MCNCFSDSQKNILLYTIPQDLPFMANFAEYPCGICMRGVCFGDEAIQCEGECQFWYHCNCIGLSKSEYDELSVSSCVWECPKCKNDNLSVLNSVEAIDVFPAKFAHPQTDSWSPVLQEVVVDIPF